MLNTWGKTHSNQAFSWMSYQFHKETLRCPSSWTSEDNLEMIRKGLQSGSPLRTMSTASVLFLIAILSLIWTTQAYVLEYKGFDNCGSGGWQCDSNSTDFEVTYKCNEYYGMAVRLWVWTARIPSRTTILGVENCRSVELHMDCTMGYRSYSLKQFHVTNVEFLEILPPLRPHVFLHDNDEQAHAPPELLFKNVTHIKWAERTFEKAAGRCRTKQQFLKRLTFDQVSFNDFSENGVSNLTIDSLAFTASVFADKLPSNWLTVSASQIEFAKNRFAKALPSSAFEFEADQVLFRGNKFYGIGSQALTLRGSYFEFSDNEVFRTNEKGFKITARVVNITRNSWTTIDSHAFAEVSPGEKLTENFVAAARFQFHFSDNSIESISENSLHPDYHAYKSVCSSIVVERNKLPCTCQLPFEDPALNRSREWWTHFYGELALTESNYCAAAPDCSLQQTLKVLQGQNCSSEVHAEAVCKNITAQYYTPTDEPTKETVTEPTTVSTTTTTKKPENPVPEHSQAQPVKDEITPKTIIFLVVGSLAAITVILGILYKVSKIRGEASEKPASSSYHHHRNVEVEGDDDEENLLTEPVGPEEGN